MSISSILAGRPRRSVLYVPGINDRALEKAASLDVDGLILDLEDSIAPDKKTEALSVLSGALQLHDYGRREISVRVSGLDSPTIGRELAALAKLSVDIINFPKIESRDQVMRAVGMMDATGCKQPISLMIESPKAIMGLDDILKASDRVAGIVLGTSDMIKELNAHHMPGRENLLYALSKAVFAAKASNVFVIDGVSLDLTDDDLHARLCQQGRDMGFDGKSLIHPKQVPAANMAFTPSAEEIDQARRIIDAHRHAMESGQGIVVVDGKLIENLHVEQAEKMLVQVTQIASMHE